MYDFIIIILHNCIFICIFRVNADLAEFRNCLLLQCDFDTVLKYLFWSRAELIFFVTDSLLA